MEKFQNEMDLNRFPMYCASHLPKMPVYAFEYVVTITKFCHDVESPECRVCHTYLRRVSEICCFFRVLQGFFSVLAVSAKAKIGSWCNFGLTNFVRFVHCSRHFI